mgnify:CR=1 FL=1
MLLPVKYNHMEKIRKTCEHCGAELKPSQYARRIKDDGTAAKASENLVCRNFPNCPKAEKEVNGKNKQ